jgi:hypothetical protein
MTVGNVSSAISPSPTASLRKALQSVSSSSSSSTTQTPAQEALETPAQTKAEAAKGDPQAKLKLARQQVAQGNPQAAPADSDGDHDNSSLNVTA